MGVKEIAIGRSARQVADLYGTSSPVPPGERGLLVLPTPPMESSHQLSAPSVLWGQTVLSQYSPCQAARE